jgi:2-keto-3-deoxy-L-rhamnonate aldolase RhmA
MGHVPLDYENMAIAKVIKAAKGAGKYAGHFALGAEEAARRWNRGSRGLILSTVVQISLLLQLG